MVTRSRKTIATNPLDEIATKAKPAAKAVSRKKSARAADPTPSAATPLAAAKTKGDAVSKRVAKASSAKVPKNAQQTETAELAQQVATGQPQVITGQPEASPVQTAEHLMAEELAQVSPSKVNRAEEIVSDPCTPVKVLAQPGTPQPHTNAGIGAVDTQVLTAEDVFQTELTRVHADIKQEISRSKRAALKIVTRWSRWSVAASVIPAPFIDMAAISGVQVKMIYALCKQYEVDFEHKAAIAIASGVTGGAAVQTVASLLAKQLIRITPGVGTIFMFAVEPVISYATTYAMGVAFISHFEADGRLHDFNPETIRQYLAAQIDKRKPTLDSKAKSAFV